MGDTYYESVCMFVIFLLIARYLEFLTRWYAISASERMTQTTPTVAKKLGADNRFEVVSATSLKVGDDIQINPGAAIPADSIIKQGVSHVDESILTGENNPIKKCEGDYLLGGSHNLEGNLIATVSCISEKSTLSNITRLVERAQTEKPLWVTTADRYASVFVMAVIALTSASALHGWFNGDPKWFSTALSVLVVTCPCALSLATPTAYTAAMSSLFNAGILVTNGHALEKLASIKKIIFDKTGTLTEATISVSNCHIHTTSSPQAVFDLASSLETHSDHPIAQAFLSRQTEQNIQATDITHIDGQGISGNVDGKRYYLGSKTFIANTLGKSVQSKSSLNSQVFLSDNTQLIATFELNNTLRQGVKSLISWLKKQGQQVSILSGDHIDAVSSFANHIGIDSYTSNVSPSDKLEKIKQLQAEGHPVAMIGDGINDAPVLAKADVSISVSSATQLASASSDILLLRNDMSNLKHVFLISKKTKQIIVQNMGWALFYNLAALPLALLGHIEPWQAALGMSVSSLVVVVNSFRIRLQATSSLKTNNFSELRSSTNG
jgi:Cu2+-exporting ATPase